MIVITAAYTALDGSDVIVCDTDTAGTALVVHLPDPRAGCGAAPLTNGPTVDGTNPMPVQTGAIYTIINFGSAHVVEVRNHLNELLTTLPVGAPGASTTFVGCMLTDPAYVVVGTALDVGGLVAELAVLTAAVAALDVRVTALEGP